MSSFVTNNEQSNYNSVNSYVSINSNSNDNLDEFEIQHHQIRVIDCNLSLSNDPKKHSSNAIDTDDTASHTQDSNSTARSKQFLGSQPNISYNQYSFQSVLDGTQAACECNIHGRCDRNERQECKERVPGGGEVKQCHVSVRLPFEDILDIFQDQPVETPLDNHCLMINHSMEFNDNHLQDNSNDLDKDNYKSYQGMNNEYLIDGSNNAYKGSSQNLVVDPTCTPNDNPNNQLTNLSQKNEKEPLAQEYSNTYAMYKLDRKIKVNDWMCHFCSNLNQSFRWVCNQCGEDKCKKNYEVFRVTEVQVFLREIL